MFQIETSALQEALGLWVLILGICRTTEPLVAMSLGDCIKRGSEQKKSLLQGICKCTWFLLLLLAGVKFLNIKCML